MRTKKNHSNGSAEKTVKAIRREQISQNLYYRWSTEFLEAGKKRLAGDTKREATSDEVQALRTQAVQLKELLAEMMIEIRLLKKACSGMGRSVYEVHGPGEARDHCVGGTLQSVGATHARAVGHSPIHVLRLVPTRCRGRRGDVGRSTGVCGTLRHFVVFNRLIFFHILASIPFFYHIYQNLNNINSICDSTGV